MLIILLFSLLRMLGIMFTILFPFFLLDQKETKNQGCRKIAKIYCMPLRRISILAAFVFQSANALLSIFKQLKIFAA
jgi:branched-subunit amino acid transport protein AzlD